MTRNHFTALADTLAGLEAIHGENIPAGALEAAMVTFCADQNPRFSPSTFRDRIATKRDDMIDRWMGRA